MRHAAQLSFLGTRAWDQRLFQVLESFDSLDVENDAVFLLNIAAHISATGLVYMFATPRNHLDAGVLPLWNAVFCLDCEVIRSSRGDECVACKSRSLVSLARMLGGSLLAHRAQHFQEWEGGLFGCSTSQLRLNCRRCTPKT
jgi:hypothetical protein